MLMMLLSNTRSYAISSLTSDGKVTCKEVIESCNKALEAKEEQVKLGNEALKASMEETKALEEQVKAKEGQLNNPIRQPVVLVGLGVIGTVLAGPVIAGLGTLILHVILK